QGSGQNRIRQVVSERGEADLARLEGDLRRAEQAPCAVHDAQRLERGRFAQQVRPDAEPREERNGSREECRGPLVSRRGRANQDYVISVIGDAEGRCQADWAAPDDCDPGAARRHAVALAVAPGVARSRNSPAPHDPASNADTNSATLPGMRPRLANAG